MSIRWCRTVVCAAALCMWLGFASPATSNAQEQAVPAPAALAQPGVTPSLEIPVVEAPPADVWQMMPEPTYAAPSRVGVPSSVYVPNLNPGWEFSAGALLMKPSADNLGFATITTFLPLQNPQWAVQTLEPGYQPGFNVGARYVIPGSGTDFRGNWDHLNTNDSRFVAVGNPNTQWISPFSQTGPSMSENANQVGIFHFKSASGEVNFGYDTVNFDLGQSVNVGPHSQFRVFAGLSYAHLKQRLVSRFYNDPTILPVPPVIAVPDPNLRYIELDNMSSYSGVGPRLGFSTDYQLFRGFSFIGELSGSVFAGRMQPAQYKFSGVFVNRVDNEKIASDALSQVVYAGDAKFGFGYVREVFNGSILKLESGFRAAMYINPFSTYETSTNVLALDIGSLSTSSMRHTPSNFMLSGFYWNCSLQW